MQTSFENINPSNLKNFVRKLSAVSGKYPKAKPYKIPETATENELRDTIYQLGDELQKTKEERDMAVEDNRNKIDELTNALASVKTTIKDLLEAKKERVKHLERKIRETIN
ncbi:MAG: hypothetical protein V1831_04235 [Candidatus Woesearchaeota archaeon]